MHIPDFTVYTCSNENVTFKKTLWCTHYMMYTLSRQPTTMIYCKYSIWPQLMVDHDLSVYYYYFTFFSCILCLDILLKMVNFWVPSYWLLLLVFSSYINHIPLSYYHELLHQLVTDHGLLIYYHLNITAVVHDTSWSSDILLFECHGSSW